jgi:hypothetical protein
LKVAFWSYPFWTIVSPLLIDPVQHLRDVPLFVEHCEAVAAEILGFYLEQQWGQQNKMSSQ